MNQQIAPGTTVYDSTGEKIGKVRTYHAAEGFIDVEKGWLLTKDFYVPASLVTRADADGIYLQVSKSDLQSGQYDQPAGSGGTVTGTAPQQTGTTVYSASGSAGTMETATGADTGAEFTTAGTTGSTTETAGPARRTDTGTIGTTQGDVVIPEYQEDLVAGKRQEEVGHVHLHKEVVEEQQTVPVDLSREHVEVERVQTGREIDPATARDAFQSTDIDVPVMGEEATMSKRVMETEEVRLHKDVTTEHQEVSDTVRKERVVVDPPNADVDTLPNPATIDPQR